MKVHPKARKLHKMLYSRTAILGEKAEYGRSSYMRPVIWGDLPHYAYIHYMETDCGDAIAGQTPCLCVNITTSEVRRHKYLCCPGKMEQIAE